VGLHGLLAPNAEVCTFTCEIMSMFSVCVPAPHVPGIDNAGAIQERLSTAVWLPAVGGVVAYSGLSNPRNRRVITGAVGQRNAPELATDIPGRIPSSSVASRSIVDNFSISWELMSADRMPLSVGTSDV
jgi:hypothetical protein